LSLFSCSLNIVVSSPIHPLFSSLICFLFFLILLVFGLIPLFPCFLLLLSLLTSYFLLLTSYFLLLTSYFLLLTSYFLLLSPTPHSENTCTAKADAADWAALGYTVENPASTTVSGLGSVSILPSWSGGGAIACNGGEFSVPSATENACTAKADAAAWMALGFFVQNPTATTVSGLGLIWLRLGWFGSTAVQCTSDGDEFSVPAATEKSCTAKADAAEWAAKGLLVANPTAATVSGLGSISLLPNWSGSYVIMCSGGDFITFNTKNLPSSTSSTSSTSLDLQEKLQE
jgi:hypothetical protein